MLRVIVILFFLLFLNRCLFASFLTIALQTNLVYLTNILEVLTKDLMEQSSNIQPKLMLRRTESVVEKLLTNWMSVCLSGFLRASIIYYMFLLYNISEQETDLFAYKFSWSHFPVLQHTRSPSSVDHPILLYFDTVDYWHKLCR